MKNIILVGYMACGKSSIGRILSRQLKWKLIDTDTYIEQKTGRSIKEIFAVEGEACFRELETQCVRELLQQYAQEDSEHIIVATGGGLPLKDVNRQLLKKLGRVFWLQASEETIYERVKGDTTRPLLQCENPLERIGKMLAQRQGAYEDAADIKINVDGKNREEIAEEILSL